MKKRLPKLFFLLSIGLCNLSFGKDFGPMGQVFPIEEESLLEFLQRKLSERKVDGYIASRLVEKAKIPAPVKGIKSAKTYRSFLLDLSFELEKTITDAPGTIIAKAGTIVNPLAKMKLSSGLIFLDGSNEMHLEWARKQTGNFKWILTNGQPIQVEEQEKRPVYFDQWGIYVSRFRIQHVPAKIVQKGKFLFIEEIALEERS